MPFVERGLLCDTTVTYKALEFHALTAKRNNLMRLHDWSLP